MEKHAYLITGILWLINSNVTESIITALLSSVAGLGCFIVALILLFYPDYDNL